MTESRDAISVAATLAHPCSPPPTMPPAASTAIPPANADLATTWAFLEDGVDHIMTKLQTGVSYSKVRPLFWEIAT